MLLCATDVIVKCGRAQLVQLWFYPES